MGQQMTRNPDTAKQWAIALGFVAFVLALYIAQPYMPWRDDSDPDADRHAQDERRDAAIDAAESGRYP